MPKRESAKGTTKDCRNSLSTSLCPNLFNLVQTCSNLFKLVQKLRQSSCGRVLIPLITYLWTKSDIIVHSVVFYEEVGSFSLSWGGCFRGCSYSLLRSLPIQSLYSSQQPLILESADLGLHSGNFDPYSFHFKKKLQKMTKKERKLFFKNCQFYKSCADSILILFAAASDLSRKRWLRLTQWEIWP